MSGEKRGMIKKEKKNEKRGKNFQKTLDKNRDICYNIVC